MKRGESINNRLVSRLVQIYNLFKDVLMIYLVWIILHYTSSRLYSEYCTPSGIYGFLLSPFIAPSIHCQALRFVIAKGGEIINQMWILLGTWVLAKIAVKIF